MWIQLNSQLINLDHVSNIDIYHVDIPNNCAYTFREYTVRFFSSDLSLRYSFTAGSKEKAEEVMDRITIGLISGLKFLNLDKQ